MNLFRETAAKATDHRAELASIYLLEETT